MKKLSFILAMSLASIAANAQMYQVYGHVQDGSSQPVAGQLVTISSYNQFTATGTTDANGDYSIDIPNATPAGVFIDVNVYATTCSQNYYDSTYWTVQQDFESNFTICGTNPPPSTYWINGQVLANGVGAQHAVVYLINEEYDQVNQTYFLTAIDSAFTDTMNGWYSLSYPANPSGDLKVKAALLPASPDYANYMPTYVTSSLTWNGTGVSTITPNVNASVNVNLLAGTNPGGPAFIGGDVLQGANKSTAPGDPLEGRILILTTAADVPVAYTYSDANGHFSITGLDYGSYKLFGDVWNINNPAIQFTLTPTNPSLTSIEFQENSESFDGLLWPESVTSVELSNVSVYPNPVSDVLNVQGLDKVEGAKTITISGINGAVVFSSTYAQNDKVSIPVSGLSSGIYMLQINTSNGNAIYKIVK